LNGHNRLHLPNVVQPQPKNKTADIFPQRNKRNIVPERNNISFVTA
jgi:hypothetical protein